MHAGMYGAADALGGGYGGELGAISRASFDGRLPPRDILYPEAFAPAQYGDLTGAGYISVRPGPSLSPTAETRLFDFLRSAV